MPIVKLDHVSKSYAANLVLDDICWQVSANDRVGLIGNNGTGKTTLFKIMTGEITRYKGTVERAKRAIVGYLSQEPEFDSDMKLRDAVRMAAFEHMHDLEERMELLTQKMCDPEEEDQTTILDQ